VGGRCLANFIWYRVPSCGGGKMKKTFSVCPNCGYLQSPPFWAFCPLCGFTFPRCWESISLLLQKQQNKNLKKGGK